LAAYYYIIMAPEMISWQFA